MVNNITFQIHGQTYVPIKTASGNNLLKETFINVFAFIDSGLVHTLAAGSWSDHGRSWSMTMVDHKMTMN